MLLLLTLLACNPEDVVAPDTSEEVAAPAVWGVEAAEDLDPVEDVVEVHLTAGTTMVEWLEGEKTQSWSYNGQVPGPLIEATVGDTLRVVFTNELEEPTTIHWHGLRVPDHMDGVPAIQTPIEPGETFTYEFELPDAGTYWYHPHVRSNEQIERGLQGLIVVHEAEPPAVDRDRYFAIDDVLLQDDGRFSTFNLDMAHMDGMHGRHGNVLLVNGQADILKDTVRPGGVERWRLVNTANARTMFVEITGADWRVVGVDGGLLEEPFTTDLLRLPVGRRFDLEVIPHTDTNNVKLFAKLPSGFGWDRYRLFVGDVEGEPGAGEPLEWPAAEVPPVEEVEQVVTLDLDVGSGQDLSWTINGVSWGEGDVIPVVGGVPTRLEVRDHSGFEHPFHLHGQFFQLSERNGEPGELPGQLDTILVEGFDELVLYTTFDNPGLWMAHCHILEHAELGMMTALEVVPQ